MMTTTHVFAGLALCAPVAMAYPEFATPLAAGAIVGGLAPDADVVATHRRTFHFPILGGVVAIPAVLLAVALPTTVTVAVAAAAVAAWLHAASDAYGGGSGFDPWENPIDRAVYDHVRGRWIAPRGLIRYDGAPEDAVLAVGLGLVALLVFDGWVDAVVLAGIALSIGYALLRRRIPGLLETMS